MLEGLRVLDLTWVLGGPFAGQLMAQLGADVIKIETLSGDLSRAVPPHWIQGDSAYYLSVNRGKKSIALDLKSEGGRHAFEKLVATSDAVIYGFAPDVPKRLGIDHESLLAINPRICVAELIGLHDEGEYSRAPAYDLIVQAMGGVMSITGAEGGEPARVGYQIGDLSGGLYLALGLTATLAAAQRDGKGRKVQISLLDCQVSLLTWQAQNYFASGEIPVARGSRNPVLAPSEVYRCADGRHLAVSPTGDNFWRNFCEILGRPDLVTDPLYATRQARIENGLKLSEILGAIFETKPATHWASLFFAERVPAAIVHRVDEAVSQPVARLRNMVEEVEKPDTGVSTRFLGNPFKYEDSKVLGYPPAHGADGRDLLRDLCGYDDATIDELIKSQAIK
ncbi:CoA transferase [Mesorhizobium sp. BE184]|uniref:CaiB/BaiF CoA transferase family protein n=1 Tax=Mesorhizobium sp. BE184 TaxID=2817714 RepID=UPI00286751F5|nr:CoA transferase [Mesorhizobium sp. BE184]MDR7034152.1 crotonobetainyl-CoA:carnitine CoA-transferase CaiB-like acyl-CoA transferase [Mesorhizobium sp. BE184]